MCYVTLSSCHRLSGLEYQHLCSKGHRSAVPLALPYFSHLATVSSALQNTSNLHSGPPVHPKVAALAPSGLPVCRRHSLCPPTGAPEVCVTGHYAIATLFVLMFKAFQSLLLIFRHKAFWDTRPRRQEEGEGSWVQNRQGDGGGPGPGLC